MEVKDHLGDIVSGIPPNMEVKNHFRGPDMESRIIWGDIISGIPSDRQVKDHLRCLCQWNPTIYGSQGSFEETLSVESHQIRRPSIIYVTLSVESHQIRSSRIIWGEIVSGIPPDMEVKDHLRRHCQWNPIRYGGQVSFTWHCQWNPTRYEGQGSFMWHCQWNPTIYEGQGSFKKTLCVESHQIRRSRIV